MAWNDGTTEQIYEYLDNLKDLGDVALNAAHAVIDTEIAQFKKRVVSKTPVGPTGGLKASLNFSRITDRGSSYYGQEAIFEGNAPNGEPYEKIANVLNYGTKDGRITGTQFVSNAIRYLKGMDERIEARIEAELSKRT